MRDATLEMVEPVESSEVPQRISLDARLNEVATVLVGMREIAVRGRRDAGIDAQWERWEQAYAGLDSENAHEMGISRWSKSTSLQGGLTEKSAGQNDLRAVLYPRLTARYVDAGCAKINEIILSSDDTVMGIEPTPVPDVDMEALKASDAPVLINGIPAQKASPMTPADGAPNGSGVQPPGAPLTGGLVPLRAGDLAKEAEDLANQSSKKAQRRIHDYMIESNYAREMRKVSFDMTRLGVGVMKGPFPEMRESVVARQSQTPDGQGIDVVMERRIVPGYRWVNPWNVYPDPSCGELIGTGSYCFESDYATERQIRDLKDQPGYLASQLDLVLKDGPSKENEANAGRARSASPNGSADPYTIWYFVGMPPREHWSTLREAILAAMAPDTTEDMGADVSPESLPNVSEEPVSVLVTMIGDRVVRVAVNPLERSGSLGYYNCPWQRRVGSWVGIGVAEQVWPSQRMATASIRNMLQNAGLASGANVVINTKLIRPSDGNFQLGGWKAWQTVSETFGQEDVTKAFLVVQFPMMQRELQAIYDLANRMAEESTSIPLVSMGMSGKTTPETLGQTQLQDSNAQQLLRNVAYQIDEHITEPITRASYEYLLLDPSVPNDEKGDVRIHARGSAALVERAIHDQALVQLLAVLSNPIYANNPKKLSELILKSKRIDPRDVQYTDDELQKLAQNQQPPPMPQVEAAKVRADSDQKIAQLDAQIEAQKAKMNLDRDMAAIQAKRDLLMLEYSMRHQITLDEVKVQLAINADKLRTQKELAGMDGRGPQIVAPPTEPPGRAPNGAAYQQ